MVATGAKAAEIRITCSGAMRPALEELAPQFERASGHKLAITYASTGVIRERALAGDAGDLVIFAGPAVEDVVRAGRLAAKVDLVRSGVGVGVRAGSPRPDLSSAEAFKRTLLAAKSVAYIDPKAGGSSGIYVDGLLQRLGIADQVRAKAVLVQGGAVAEHVADGEAEIGVHQISEILPVAGVTLVGPLPADIQNFTVYAAGLGTAAKDQALAKGFVEFLTGAHAIPIIKAKGMQPAAS
jgi:molybdate transport system substrate-binding protein